MLTYSDSLQITRELSLDEVKPSAFMLRTLDQNVVRELAKSIREIGLLQPILVRPSQSSYELVFGHHRLEACRSLSWKSIPAIVKEMSHDDCLLTKIAENLQRNVEINPVREAECYIALVDHGWTINKIAQRIGKSDSYVSDRIGLIRRLDPVITRKMTDPNNGHLKPSHLELLARLKSKSEQLEFSKMIETKGLSVRKLEKLIFGGHPLRRTIDAMVCGPGNSLCLRLPEEIVEHLKLKSGDAVYVYAQSRRRIAIEVATMPN